MAITFWAVFPIFSEKSRCCTFCFKKLHLKFCIKNAKNDLGNAYLQLIVSTNFFHGVY